MLLPALTAEQEIVRTKLIEVAQQMGQMITYGEVADLVGWGRATSVGPSLLDDINRYEHEHDRPLLSASVVNQDTCVPGEGFWVLATELGLFEHGDDRIRYWKRERRRVRAYWRRQAADLQ